MSRLKSDNINFNNDDFLVEVIGKTNLNYPSLISEETTDEEIKEEDHKEEIFDFSEYELQAQEIIENAKKEAQSILDNTNKEIEELKTKTTADSENAIENANKEAASILENAKKEAQSILDNANEEASKLLEDSKSDIEAKKQEAARLGYDDGYQDAKEKFLEETEEKINDFDNFCNLQLEVKKKILQSASKDILNLIENISRKVLLKEVEGPILDNIIKKTISLLEKKEDITIVLSEKYAKLLYTLQNKSLDNEVEFDFQNFKNYEGFKVEYNPELLDDTIIVENLKERFDASIKSQLDIIIKDIYKKSKNLEIEHYLQKDET